jgi:hypothetical protein
MHAQNKEGPCTRKTTLDPFLLLNPKNNSTAAPLYTLSQVSAAAALPALTVALESLAVPSSRAFWGFLVRAAPLVVAALVTSQKDDFDLCAVIPVLRKPALRPAATAALAYGAPQDSRPPGATVARVP